MSDKHESVDHLLRDLRERAKELNCLYEVEEILNCETDVQKALYKIIRAVPKGFLYPEYCSVNICCDGKNYLTLKQLKSSSVLKAYISVQNLSKGEITVFYTESMPEEDEGPFLKEEKKLLINIADRIGKFIYHQESKSLLKQWDAARNKLAVLSRGEWQVIVDLLQKTDVELFVYVARKMSYHLCWLGIFNTEKLFCDPQDSGPSLTAGDSEELNSPCKRIDIDMGKFGKEVFNIASRNISDDEMLILIRKWIQENRIRFLVKSCVATGTILGEIKDTVSRFYHMSSSIGALPDSTLKSINSSLVNRLFSDHLEYINIAKKYIDVDLIHSLLKRVVFPAKSRGKIGGKGAGMLLAYEILRSAQQLRQEEDKPALNIKIPKTWFITSDALMEFIYFNSLEEIVEQKYKEIDRVRLEYPHIIQIFKNSLFPGDILQGLTAALDDFGPVPLIVRSSSLLEDRLGTAFSGKYKSLFLANRGTKGERLASLTDAITEVYASTFGPDPIEYRSEKGLVDYYEEMGIMIQEVVGNKVGRYFFPSFSGVAFSHNEFRWSPRIKHKDGLIRLVPGLGTRAVDRLKDDYPVLIAPGQPELRVNVTVDEILKYSPKQADVINLETNAFETVYVADIIREYGDAIASLEQLVSVYKDGQLEEPDLMSDFKSAKIVLTFEKLRSDGMFVSLIADMLSILKKEIGFPVDIEFACNGRELFLLQCRPQSSTSHPRASLIPKDIPSERILFTANRYVSNGIVGDISHLVYVDPQKYEQLSNREDLLKVGKVISRLNKLLPKRQFVLMGPGRWGSRGDVKLGVNVTYSDINNTAMLVEIARKKGSYLPELSFGTHFFQDLVEASIRYLPLYPDSAGVVFNGRFFRQKKNILEQLLPEYAYLGEVIRVLDVPVCTGGKVLRILQNAELDEAVAYLSVPRRGDKEGSAAAKDPDPSSFCHWRWRQEMAEHIASLLNPGRFAVAAFYLFGSTKNGSAGPASDIDIILHFRGTELQREQLLLWLEGWSLSLDEMNYLKTGYRSGGLLDVHLVTDQDIEKGSSFAAKIGAVTDAAREVKMGGERG